MTDLYRIDKSAEEIAGHFEVDPAAELVTPGNVGPGDTGLIVRTTSAGRVMQAPRWGFPRPRSDVSGFSLDAPPINLATDVTNALWHPMVPDPRYRCLIPATAFAQPEGAPGAMTCTWFSVPDWPLLAFAGFCRATAACGPVYALLTCDSNAAVASLNARMPVILAPDEYDRWLEGSVADIVDFQSRMPLPQECMEVDRTNELWPSRRRARPPIRLRALG